MIINLEKSINEFYTIDNSKSTIEKIYDLFENKNIKDSLILLNQWSDTNLITSILPLESEFSWGGFRDIFFRYINTRDIKREWPWFLSKIVSLIR